MITDHLLSHKACALLPPCVQQHSDNDNLTGMRNKCAKYTKENQYRLQICGKALCRINEVTLWWARLVLGWVTVYGQVNHLGAKPAS